MKQFLDIFRQLSERYSSWNVWADFVNMSAASIANAVDKRQDIWQRREDEYLATIKKYSKSEQKMFVDLFVSTVLSLEADPNQDFLGNLYMELNLTNHWKGQFFTPWDVSTLMARMTIDAENVKERISSEHYITICDSACGSGAILLAAANTLKDIFHINYQQSVLFVAQDVDPIVAKMCYIQMSLLGMPGYVVIGNTLTEPVHGSALHPVFKDASRLWFTPMYYENTWAMRRMLEETLRLERVEVMPSVVTIEKPGKSEKHDTKSNGFWSNFWKKHD